MTEREQLRTPLLSIVLSDDSSSDALHAHSSPESKSSALPSLLASPQTHLGKELFLYRVLGLLSASDVCRWGATSRAWREVARSQAVWIALRTRDQLPHRLTADEIRALYAHAVELQPRSPLVDDFFVTASRFSVWTAMSAFGQEEKYFLEHMPKSQVPLAIGIGQDRSMGPHDQPGKVTAHARMMFGAEPPPCLVCVVRLCRIAGAAPLCSTAT